MIHLLRLLNEARRDSSARPLLLIFFVAITGTAVAGIALTSGRTAAAEIEVLNSIETAASRTVVITATNEAGISQDAVVSLLTLEPVEWALALSAAEDVSSEPVGIRVPMRMYRGEIPPSIKLLEGREPRTGEAIIGRSATGPQIFAESYGLFRTDNGDSIPVVGVFEALAGTEFLADSLLVNEERPLRVRTIVVQAEDFSSVAAVVESGRALSNLPDSDIRIEESLVANNVRALVTGTLGEFSRNLVLYVAGTSAAVIGLVTFTTVSSRRKDIGRRRALGASRPAVFVLVVAGSVMSALIGSTLGALCSIVIYEFGLRIAPDYLFILSSAYLIVLTSALGAAPAAALASFRDPVRVLRVP